MALISYSIRSDNAKVSVTACANAERERERERARGREIEKKSARAGAALFFLRLSFSPFQALFYISFSSSASDARFHNPKPRSFGPDFTHFAYKTRSFETDLGQFAYNFTQLYSSVAQLDSSAGLANP